MKYPLLQFSSAFRCQEISPDMNKVSQLLTATKQDFGG